MFHEEALYQVYVPLPLPSAHFILFRRLLYFTKNVDRLRFTAVSTVF